MSDEKKKKAEQLLEAQVDHMVAQLTGASFKKLVKEEVDHFFKVAATIRLNEMVSADQIKTTARKYTVEMPISAAIPELMGEIADRIYNHPGHDNNSFADLVHDREVRDAVEVILEMGELRQRLMSEIGGSALTLNLISDMLYRGIRGFVMEGTNMAGNIPGASSMMKFGKSMMSKAAPGLEKTAETSIKKYISHNTRTIIRHTEKRLEKSIESGEFEKAVMEFWDEFKDQKIGELRRYMTRDELEDLLVTGLEIWQQVRQTRYFNALLDEGIQFFFDKYGDTPLDELIGEMGVTRKMIIDDANHYAPHIIKELKKRGILQDTLRRRLATFWEDPKVLEML